MGSPRRCSAPAPAAFFEPVAVDDRATTILMNRFYENYTGSYKDVRLGRRALR
jgi:hypothetical protein